MCPFTEQTALISCSLPDFDRQRLIEAEWQQGAADEENGGHGRYLAELKIFGNNRTGLLVDISRSVYGAWH